MSNLDASAIGDKKVYSLKGERPLGVGSGLYEAEVKFSDLLMPTQIRRIELTPDYRWQFASSPELFFGYSIRWVRRIA